MKIYTKLVDEKGKSRQISQQLVLEIKKVLYAFVPSTSYHWWFVKATGPNY
jgi:hypothetical protein